MILFTVEKRCDTSHIFSHLFSFVSTQIDAIAATRKYPTSEQVVPILCVDFLYSNRAFNPLLTEHTFLYNRVVSLITERRRTLTLRDRGTKKWTAFMMPEHVGMVKQFLREDNKLARPELSENQFEEIELVVQEGLEHKLLLEITTWKDGYFTKSCGYVKKVIPHGRTYIPR